MAQSDYYTSTNSGATWVSNSLNSVMWNAVACSADGTKLVAAALASGRHYLLTSTNSGATWMTNSPPVGRTVAVASSADGTKLIAVEEGVVWSSTNSGLSWASTNLAGFWLGAALSADGGRQAIGEGSPGEIWTSQTTTSPQMALAISGGVLIASWTVPSTNFILEQSADLISWSAVTNPAVFNVANLQYQTSVAATNFDGFYRLATQ
jgi:hypothetical protein